ncbi:protein kinase domain-containing protein [Haloactinomyces albus]|uniref:non-specific serine/threonine protein kinase n=1 Tax=Haloactinomyces albus TaxID=1352928 RepID=A0AAE3ZII1_9ACTN|nr:protein kinase [Haloactinomyces albus]MDR7304223.1 serine/threonine protein kinase [Haloactinomyces albus]
MAQHRVIAGRYELTSPIGRGAMGQVWTGYDQRLDRRIAVKLLPASKLVGTEDPDTLTKRFVRESRLTAKVEHPSVPAVHDAGSDGDDLFLVMQLVEGTDLGDLIAEQGPLSVSWAAVIAAQIASVFASAHGTSLVHRDLKPRNVRIASSGAVKVLDFGIAAALESNATKLTRTHDTLGTPAYMAPEQAMSGTATPHSDLYSLGCVLHEMLSGQQVFTAPLPLAVMHKHLEEPPEPLRQCGVEVPEPLEKLVLDLLAKNPEDRPADAHEVYQRLFSFLPKPEETAPAAREGDPTAPYRHPLAPRSATRHSFPETAGPEPAAVSTERAEARIREDQERAYELVDEGRFTQAAELLRSLLADRSLHDRLTEARRLKVRQNLATFHFLGSDYRAALTEYTALITDLEKQPGASDETILDCRFMAASCRVELGEHAAAITELRELLRQYRHLLPQQHERLFELRTQLATLLSHTGEVDEARELLQEVLDAHGSVEAEPYVAQAEQLLRRLDRFGQ